VLLIVLIIFEDFKPSVGFSWISIFLGALARDSLLFFKLTLAFWKQIIVMILRRGGIFPGIVEDSLLIL
jgi:uncharacterized membrane protein